MNPTKGTAARTAKKVGGRRRLRRSSEEKAEYLEQFERSGMAVSAFCREHGLCEQTFYNWRARRRRTTRPLGKADFAEVAVEATSAPSGATVHLERGVWLELAAGADVTWAGRLVRELRAP